MNDARATYGGPGWVTRGGSSDEEIRAGELWAPLSCACAADRLTDVLLYRPGPSIENVADIDAALHLRRVRAAKLAAEVDALIAAYTSLGVRVHRLADEEVDDERHPNAIFLCDVFWQTPFGAVVARMANPVRAGEERAVSRALATAGVPLLMTVAGEGLLEGADCIWLREGLALVGTGVRTNAAGFEQLRERLDGLGMRCRSTRFDPVCQHLTGCLQVVAPDRVLVRAEVLPAETIPLLRKSGFHVTPVAESEEIRERYAFNFVVLEAGVVLMPANCPETRRALEKAGLRVALETTVDEYVAMAGGPCCATGVLARRP